jgi:hypothetical protein
MFLLFNSEERQECLEMKDLRGSPDPKEPRVMWNDVYLLFKQFKPLNAITLEQDSFVTSTK